MNHTKKITLTGYRVKYVDFREPKPRTIREEVYPLDKDSVAALARMELDVADFITARYSRSGYHVISVERITPRRIAELDLAQLWADAGDGEEVD